MFFCVKFLLCRKMLDFFLRKVEHLALKVHR